MRPVNAHHPVAKPWGPSPQGGFLLFSVALLLMLVAMAAFLLNRQVAGNTDVIAGEIETGVAQFVAEAGFGHALWRARQAGCTNYSGIVNQPFGEHSYSVAVSPGNGSPISISATTILSTGTGATLQRSNVPVQDDTAPLTVQLQPGPEAKDTHIKKDKPTENKGSDKNLFTSSAAAKLRRSLLQFDFSAISPTARILSASLELGVLKSDGAAHVVEAHRVLQGWSEDGATWNTSDGVKPWITPGGDFDPEVAGSFEVSSTGPVSMDISVLVHAWIRAAVPNYGLILLSAVGGSNDKKKYASSDGPAAKRPKLTLTMACECGKTCASGNGALCGGFFLDQFLAESYAGDDGDLAWPTSWLEIKENDGATAGDEQILSWGDAGNFALRVRNNGGGGEGVEREVDLSGYTSATLQFDYWRDGLASSSDYVTLELISGGGGGWTEIDRFEGPASDSSFQTVNYDISAYIGPATRIRLLTSPTMGNQAGLYVDNVRIDASRCS